MDKFDLPFEQYLEACWEHCAKKAQESPSALYVFGLILHEPATAEALWAKRYWYNKVGAYHA